MNFTAPYAAAKFGKGKSAPGLGVSFLGGPWAAGALAGAGALQGWLQGRAQSSFLKDIQGKVEGALSPNTFLKYVGVQNRAMNPMISQLSSDAYTSGITAAQGVEASVARAGLGNTGVGVALGAGARVGASRGASTLRAQLRLEALREARAMQQMEAESYLRLLGGGQYGSVSPIAATLAGAGSGFEAWQAANRAETMGGY